jgi:excisionase family DNA binding protein
MNKTDAAAFLGVSVRTLEGYVSAERLPAQYIRGKTRPVADFAEDDLQRLKTELETPIARVVANHAEPRETDIEEPRESSQNQLARLDEVQRPGGQNGALIIAASDFPALVAAIRETPQKAAEVPIPISDNAFFTVEESALYLHLPVRAIERAIKAQALPVHRELTRGRRIKRDELDKWAAKL